MEWGRFINQSQVRDGYALNFLLPRAYSTNDFIVCCTAGKNDGSPAYRSTISSCYSMSKTNIIFGWWGVTDQNVADRLWWITIGY